MKKIILFIKFFLLTQLLFGQLQVQYRTCTGCDTHGQSNSNVTYQYNVAEEYNAILVADDYGPRIDGDKWHGGVDYNSQANGEPGGGDRGDLIVSLESGTIRGELGAGYKRLFVNGTHDFGYGHFFWGNQNNIQSGGCFLSEMLTPDEEDWAIVMVVDGDTIALGPQPGNTVFSGDTLAVSDWIDAGDPIGPTGGSSNGGELGPHMHLYNNPDGSLSINDEITKNPLQYVAYADTTFDVKILKQNDIDEGITITYPGTNEQTIQVRPKLSGQPTEAKRYHKLLDVDEVKYYINSVNYIDYSLIEGPTFESRLCLGGRIGGPERYPRLADAPYPADSPFYNTEAQWGRTGIHPYAYRGDYENGVRKADPWDDYYYADFVTRIHRDDDPDEENTPTRIADTPDMARYNDGVYQIKAVVTDVRGNEHEGPKNADDELEPIEFTLDNFMPYLQNVNVLFGTVIYSKNINSFDPSTLQIDNGYVDISGAAQTATSNGATQDLTIVVRSSEPLDPATVTFSNPYLAPNPIPSTGHSDGFRNHIFNLGQQTLEEGLCYELIFTGQDFSGNDLLNLKESADNNGHVIIPKRQNLLDDNTTWSPVDYIAGSDGLHTFCFETGCTSINESDDCLEVDDFQYVIKNGINGMMSVDVTFTGGNGEIEARWEHPDGSISKSIDLIDVSPGYYCYQFQDENCCKLSGCVLVPEECPNMIESISRIRPCGGEANGLLTVNPSEDAYSPQSIEWSTGETERTIENLDEGNYCVTVLDARGCQQKMCVDLKSGYKVSSVKVRPTCPNQANGSVSITIDAESPFSPPQPICDLLLYYIATIDGQSHKVYSNQYTWTGLNAGTYCMDISGPYLEEDPYYPVDCDLQGLAPCTVTKCFTIGESNVTAKISVLAGICYEGGKGALKSSLKNGVAPFTYSWSNGASTEVISNVGAGEYSVTVSDAKGCTGEATMLLEKKSLFKIVDFVTTKKACGYNATGEVRFKIEAGTYWLPPGCSAYFEVNWAGQKKNVAANVDIYLDGFAQGEQCIWISGPYSDCVNTSIPSCTVKKCVDIGSYSLDISSYDNLAFCKGNSPSCTGKIEVASNFALLNWKGPDDFSKVTSVVNGAAKVTKLCLGYYTVVGSQGGCTLSRNVNLCCCNSFNAHNPKDPIPPEQCNPGNDAIISIDGTVTHDLLMTNQGKIYVSVGVTWKGQPTYNSNLVYFWTGPNGFKSYKKNITGLAPGKYCLKVTDGCDNEKYKCFDVFGCDDKAFSAYVEIAQKPCEGLNDGIINITIPNPNLVQVNISFDGVFFNQYSADPISFTVENVSGGVHTLEAKFGTCEVNTIIDVGFNTPTSTLVGMNKKENTCTYSMACNNMSLGTTTSSAEVSVLNPGCGFSMDCNGLDGWSIPVDMTSRRVWQYNMMFAEMSAVFPGIVVPGALNQGIITSSIADGCDWVRFCPASMNQDYVFPNLNPFIKNPKDQEPNGNCIVKKCGWSEDEYCPGSAASIFPNATGIGSTCNLRMSSLYELQLGLDNGNLASEANFFGSELYDFIGQYGHDSRAACLDVYFCSDDYSIVPSWEELVKRLEEVNCSDITQEFFYWHGLTNPANLSVSYELLSESVTYSMCNVQQSGLGKLYVYCSDGNNSFHTKIISPTGYIPNFTPNNDDHYLFVAGNGNEEFEGFAKVTNEGVCYLKGVVKTPSGRAIYDFMPKEEEIRRLNTKDNLLYFVDDLDENISYWLYHKDKVLQVDCQKNDSWTRFLDVDSNSTFDILFYEKQGNDIVIGGGYIGVLNFNGVPISKAEDYTSFVITIDTTGSIHSYNEVLGVDEQKGLFFSLGEGNSILMAAKSRTNTISWGGQGFIKDDPFFFVAEIRGDSIQIDDYFYTNNSCNLIGFSSNPNTNDSDFTLAMSKVLQVKTEGASIFYDTESKTAVFNVVNSDDVKWVYSFPDSLIYGKSLDIEYGLNDSIFIGLTFQGELNIEGQKVKSNGEFDVLILGVDGDGVFEAKSYGGPAYEEVSDIMWNNGLLYFAGTFSGNDPRKIGVYNVLGLIPETSKARKAYISFVGKDASQNYKKSAIVVDDNLEFKGKVSVYPSPFGDELTIRIVGGEQSKYIASVLDILGNKMFVGEMFVDSWDYQKQIQLTLPVGIYFLRIQDIYGNIYTQKIVKQ